MEFEDAFRTDVLGESDHFSIRSYIIQWDTLYLKKCWRIWERFLILPSDLLVHIKLQELAYGHAHTWKGERKRQRHTERLKFQSKKAILKNNFGIFTHWCLSLYYFSELLPYFMTGSCMINFFKVELNRF